MSTQSPSEEAEWIAAAQAGDPQAFNKLMRHYEERILRFLWRRVGHAADAEDLGQQVFVKAYRNLAKLDSSRPFGPWIFTIARRESASFLRRRRRLQGGLWFKSPSPPDLLSGEQEECQWIWSLARRELSDSAFSALWLSIEGGDSIRDIAVQVGKSESATKVLLHRARKQLIHTLREQGHPGRLDTPTPWKLIHVDAQL